MADVRKMVNAPIPLRAARLSRGYTEQQRHEAAKSEAASREVLRAAQAYRNPAGQAWQRMSPSSATTEQLFVRREAHGTFYIIFDPEHCRAIWLGNDGALRRTFREFGSVPVEAPREEV